jgi:cbb3-type cytochrome oxidase maturation protein
MDIIYLLIPLALVLLVSAIGAFFWAVRHDQFEDLDREANRILFDEDSSSPPPTPTTKSTAQTGQDQ